MGVLQTLSPGDYHVTVVSTDTYTIFTPLLPCQKSLISIRRITNIYIPLAAAVGTVSVRSLVEPIRKFLARLRGHFVQAKAIDIVMSERLLEVESHTSNGDKANFYIPSASPSFTFGAY